MLKNGSGTAFCLALFVFLDGRQTLPGLLLVFIFLEQRFLDCDIEDSYKTEF